MSQHSLAIEGWSEYVRVQSRFHRSVHLERDSRESSWLDGYLVTPLVRTTLARMTDGLRLGRNERAWSLTGPYGSGKSAFALFLANLFDASNDKVSAARRVLHRVDNNLHTDIFSSKGVFSKDHGLLPVLATGERASLHSILLKALRTAVEKAWNKRGGKPDVFKRVVFLQERSAAGKSTSTRDVVDAFAAVAAKVNDANLSLHGLVIVLDEAGKALEYASHNPQSGDIHLLQELAELASRSGDSPILFVVSLHQAFESYASRLSTTQRSEWGKVQGRFADVAFQEAADQVLGLIGAAIEKKEEIPSKVQALVASCAEGVVEACRLPSKDEKERVTKLLSAAAPLHPATAIVLAPLFRTRLAQNERSLFAFLSSTEPGGFQEFLGSPGVPATSQPLYAIDRLYDYAAATLGANSAGHHARCWLQVQEALKRLPPDAEEVDTRVVKVIGLLAALGDTSGLTASEDFLAASLTNGTKDSRAELRKSVERLVASSIIVYRKYKDAFQLWEGSDLDVEQLLEAAARQIDARGSVVQQLERTVAPRPIVARRHFFETGTLRYFELKYADETLFESKRFLEGTDADGVIWLVVPTTLDAARAVRTRVSTSETWESDGRPVKPIVVAIPDDAGRLRDLAIEAMALERVRAQTPQLQSDVVARRELADRGAETRRLIANEVMAVTTGLKPTTWYENGRSTKVRDARELSSLVSDFCDEAYARAPRIFNELLNRNHLSSAAASARRGLMQAMVEHADKENLSFEGYPPEVSMYRSLLVTHGLHRKRKEGWAIVEPRSLPEGSLQPAYSALEKLLEINDSKHVVMTTAYDELRRPPFGLKEGVIPVVVLAAVLHRHEEVAVYEEGIFVPNLTAPHVERLLRNPERFELQMTCIDGARSKLLDGLVGEATETGARLLPLVRNLVKTVQGVTGFAKNTKALSAKALAVREALLRAKDPGPLVFKAIPEALGRAPIEAGTSPKGLGDLSHELKACLREITKAYPALLDRVEAEVFEALGTGRAGGEKSREQLRDWAVSMLTTCGEVQLKGLLIRLADDVLAREEWVVSVATFLGGKPPEGWYDTDMEAMRQNLATLARRFRGALAVNISKPSASANADTSLMRLSIAQTALGELEQVVALRTEDQRAVERLCARFRDVIEASAADLSRETIVGGLGLVVREMLNELDSERNVNAAREH